MMRGVAVRRSAGVGRRVAAASVSALLLAGALSGCRGSKPEPTNAPSPPTETAVETPTVTREPTPTDAPIAAPTTTAAMEHDDEAGAVAAAEYFMVLYEYVLQTGDDDEWKAASGSDCGFCASLSAAVDARYADGGRFERQSPAMYDGYAVISQDASLGTYGVHLDFALAGVESINSDGTTSVESASENGSLLLALVRSASGWVLLGGNAGDAAQP